MNLADCFMPGEILLPKVEDLSRWAVIACDQFTSEPDYWQRVDAFVGDAPSTLRLTLPEIWLNRSDRTILEDSILRHMEDYLNQDLFTAFPDSFFYLERTLSSGGLRRGILGLLDLEYYDYRETSCSPIHATEGLVVDRLPPRLRLRRSADLELPHLVVFFDDPTMEVMDCAERSAGELLYLPPYSPDLNPIEMLWSKIKAILRSLEIRTAEELPNAIASAFHAVTTSDCLGWFSAAGLCS